MDSYPAVLEAQQDQQQALDTVLVKLQLELQQQLAPHQQQPSGGDDTAATPDTRLVAARLTTVKQPPQPSGSDAPSAAAAADEAAAGLEPADATAVADIVAAAVAAAVASSSSAATTPAAAMEGMEGSPSRAVSERCLSCNEEDASWHLVSRGGSVRAPSSTGRCSFEDAGAGSVSPFAPPSTTTDLSECGSEHGGTPRDELAASILGHPVMMAAQQVDAAAAAAFDAPPDGGFDSISSSITLHPSAASSCVLEPPAAAAAAAPARDGDGGPAAPGGGDGAQHALQDASGAVPVVGAGEALSLLSGGLLQLAGAAQARASEGLEGLRDWIVESLAALVQSGRMSQAACLSRAHAALAQLTLAAKQQGGLAAAAAHAASDWRLLLSSAAAVVCLAMWMKSRKEATVLRSMLRRRDHELSKLVMRVVSLQELINAGGHLQPISRFGGRSFESVTTVSASFM